jgi:phospholipid/cholesterol/gamma-HCH transport system permease protein
MLQTVALLVAAVRGATRLGLPAQRILWRVVARQVLFTGVEAVPLVALIAAVVGVLVIVQSAASLPDIGQAELMSELLVFFILKELGPILVAFVVAARSGAAIAAELATMTVRGEIDGLAGVGVDPLAYLVLPRVTGVAVAVASLTVVFNFVAFLAGFGFAAASRATLTFGGLLGTLFRAMEVGDVAVSVVKSLLLGAAIAGICAKHGLSSGRAPTDIPRVTLRAVVSTLIACTAIEVLVTAATTDFSSVVG